MISQFYHGQRAAPGSRSEPQRGDAFVAGVGSLVPLDESD
jgi:hypothetical protein